SSSRPHTRCSRDWSSDVCSSDLFMSSRLDSWRKTMEMNVFATLGLTQLVVPLMEGRDGRIIMINTTGSLRARPAGGAYGGSKARSEARRGGKVFRSRRQEPNHSD